MIKGHEGNHTRLGAGVWQDGGGVGPSDPGHRKAALRRWASGTSEGRVFQGQGTAGGRGYEVRGED